VSDFEYQSLARRPGPTSWFPDLGSYGSEAFVRLRPQIEQAGLMVALREAKDIPRMLKTTAQSFKDLYIDMGGSKTSKVLHPKSVSDNWLNHHFGWVPFINDIVKFQDVYQNSEKYIEQLSRDNNSWIKRTRVLDNVESVQRVKLGGASSGSQPDIKLFPWSMCRNQTVPGLGVTGSWYTIDEVITTRTWATGRVKYYRPEFDMTLSDYSSQWNDLQRRLKVYGAELSPINLYKSTPWTWLIDWFSNVGDQIDLANSIALDGYAWKYLYVMRHAVRQLVLTSTIYYWANTLSLQWIRSIETKQRQGATSPFGFSLLGKDISAKQWSILAALGLSRSNIAMR
jgi:hypothetical protein